MRLFNRCLWHNRENIYEERSSTFLDESVNDIQLTDFSYCADCESMFEYRYDSQGGNYSLLDQDRSAILKKKIIFQNGKMILPRKKREKNA